MINSFARAMRTERLYHHGPGLFLTPLDHSVSDGPIGTPSRPLDLLVGELAAGGVDGVVLHKGALRHVDPARFRQLSLIVHLNASTSRAADPDAKYLVADVPEALRLGADAVSFHLNLGSRTEERQVTELSRVAEQCDRWNVPLLVMVYPRGPGITDPRDPALVLHGITIAAELGADIVKAPYVGSPATMRAVTAGSPVPVIAAGGPLRDSESATVAYVRDVMAGGCRGVAMGRNVFQAADPGRTARVVGDAVHLAVHPGRNGHARNPRHHEEALLA